MSTDRERAKSLQFPLRPVSEASASAMPRRAALQTLLGAAGAGLALPSAADAQHPMERHLANPVLFEQARQRAAVGADTPVFLDQHQSKTLQALAETIVPGSTRARVGPFLDQLLAVDSSANQRTFLGALGAFDMGAVEQHGKAWIAITAAQQDAVLREASTADAATSPLRGHFQSLKDWIAGAYYTSEVGMRELGWTGTVMHQQLPGCTHPGGHLD